MINTTKPYFIQTKEWSEFWLQSAHKNHDSHYFEHKSKLVDIAAFTYQYPWYIGKYFLYIPKGPTFKVNSEITKEQLIAEYKIFLAKITEFAAQNKCVFIKLDFDYNFTDLLYIDSNNTILKFVESTTKHKTVLSTKSLQYLSTMLLDCHGLSKNDNLPHFLEDNKHFYSQTNENVRRYTRKSLKQNWQIETSKTTENFEHFWQVYESTAKRQSFAIHTKSYFETMFASEFVRIIVLKDEQNIPHCCWFGVAFGETLYYLYGGNDDYSFTHQGQYLAHLVALQIAAKEKLLSYDLGGYDSEKGFGKFKEGYRGKVVKFLGPVDIVLQPLVYNTLNKLINTVKRIRTC
jgi:lipid II:glycine glycyltransferase (peptidoglycan interpeptide bridge formation enzyme)